MSNDERSPDQAKPDATRQEARPWVRPTLTKLAAADAELGTRNTANDGQFSVS